MLPFIFLALLGPPIGTPQGIGVLHGANHAFSFQAPAGWVLDNQSGAGQGLHAVFYPEGQTWRESPVMAYARAFTLTPDIKTPAALVADTLRDFRESSPGVIARFDQSLPLAPGRTADIYFFTGDKFGNHEAVAYITEKRTINFFVLSSRDKALFQSSLPAFLALVRSYVFVSDHVEYDPPPAPPK